MTAEERARLEPYLALARDFMAQRATGADFRARFLEAFKADQGAYSPRAGELLMRIFDEAECYEPDPALLEALRAGDPDLYLDESGLRRSLRPLVRDFEAFLSGS